MTNLVNVESVSKSYGTATLLRDVSLGISEGERIGVVGRNGGGKTTLLRVLLRIEPPDAGRVTHTTGLDAGYLAQDAVLPPDATVRDVVLAGLAEHEWAGDARVRAVLEGLGVHRRLDDPVGPMSGGERRRVALATLLVGEHDLVVLDEPTNHLDVEGIAWLAEHLRGRRGALLVVTHDRWFLDAVCDVTWEVVGDGNHQRYDGGYSAWVLARAERERQAAATEARRQNLLRKELAWLRRGPPARTTKPRFRVDAANALIADEPPARDPTQLTAFATARLGKTVLELEDVSLAYGGRPILDRVTWRLGPGERTGLVGVNGSGKTTLLRVLRGAVTTESGTVVRGRTVRPAYLDQEVRGLPTGGRVLEAVEEIGRSVDLGGKSLSASQLLERFGFPAGRQWTPVGDLSGGERRRLQLLRLLMTEPNVLLLDEPTNDLDIDTLTAVEDLLDDWPGTLVVVSHDRYFLERTTDRIVALPGDGSLRALPGGVDEYLRLRRTTAVDAEAAESPARRPAGDSRAARKELVRLERLMEKLERREATLHEQLAAQATDYEAVSKLDAELKEVAAERAAAEDDWLRLSDEGEVG